MLHLFYGEDDYTVDRRAASLARRLMETGAPPAQRFDGATAPWNDIVSACRVLPFLNPCQVVRVDGLFAASARRRSEKGDDGAKPGVSPGAFGLLASSLPETTVLILTESALTPANAHLKVLDDLQRTTNSVEIHAAPLLMGAERASWVRDEVVKRGGTIDKTAATLAAERLPGSLRPLSNAIDTLLAYTGGAKITSAVVKDMVAAPDDDNVFHLGDAVAAGDAVKALTLLGGLRDGGMAEEQVMASLVGKVRDWTMIVALRTDGVSEPDAIKKLGWNPRRYAMSARGTTQFDRGELPRAFQALVVADEALKSRPGDERSLILDLLVFTLATRGDPEALRATFPIPRLS